jgi:hypothetical protein
VVLSEGLGPSPHDEAILQALELLTRDAEDDVRLQLTDHKGRKAYRGGQMYLIQHLLVLDILDRYDIDDVEVAGE